MKLDQLKPMVEALLMVADQPLTIEQLAELFEEYERPGRPLFRDVLQQLQADYEGRGIELIEVASGWRIQARTEYATRIARLWQERPQRYSRALLETLALIAYRQPVTRGDIEEIRGVSVSSSIMKTLLGREWVRIVGYRDVPGRPAMYATTRQFLDYFNLKSLDQMPTLTEIRDLGEEIKAQQQAEIAEEEARMLAAQEEKRRQMMAQALAEGELDDTEEDPSDYGDEQGNSESGTGYSENSDSVSRDSKNSDSGQADNVTAAESTADDEDTLSFADLSQRLDERLNALDQAEASHNDEAENDKPQVLVQDLPPTPDDEY